MKLLSVIMITMWINRVVIIVDESLETIFISFDEYIYKEMYSIMKYVHIDVRMYEAFVYT